MANSRSISDLQAVRFDPAALLLLKLLAFGLMVADHADMFLGSGEGVHAFAGRMVYPIFGVLFAYNLARCDLPALGRSVSRLLLLALLSQPLYAYLQGGFLPLNIMATLWASAVLYAAVAFRRTAPVFLVSALACCVLADYSAWGVLGVVFVALAFRAGEPWRIWMAITGFVASLGLTNGTQWALVALPGLWLASRIHLGDAPRLKWLFWGGYPLHLLMLAVLAECISN